MERNDYYTRHYRTEWPDRDNVVISLYESGDPLHLQLGIVEVGIHKTGKHQGEALVWNLYVSEEHRGRGLGRMLMSDAYDVAMLADCHTACLEWSLKESPRWVAEWYARLGYDEREFGHDSALMALPIVENQPRREESKETMNQ